ncbi:phosphomannomutase [Pseudooceanicola sp. CBS1P-1]|uniref:Phosphomannomutase n=1 Tax=Pseudooceanicola albus TaxID=2692189 RepID=A0A6L7G064_9RHOB|nr:MULTISPECIES: phosphomannomutase [Pseudooceanicola]MBT9382336.1 phosphomannomutase [Pseudooceanicola endophyticus]MXN16878.1 phosphomannomutase [Pseudooceanicola albus]
MAPKFGTSGLRGLVVELTAELVSDYTRAFLAACPTGGAVHVGWDLRPSSPDIAAVVMQTIAAEGVAVMNCGALPTPALALDAMAAGHAAVMITGSHIPADRNGLKFYVPSGEISKADEEGINANLGRAASGAIPAPIVEAPAALPAYVERYKDGFGTSALAGLKIGVYQHSSVARGAMVEVVEGLGAEAVILAPSDVFIPVDTEALDAETRAMLSGWCSEHGLDAVISTDGDADRPMVADATGRIVPGDVLGALSAKTLGAKVICTPVSSNTLVQEMGFDKVVSTKIGSPFVIAAMEAELAADPAAAVVGYEANGGFLLGFAASGPAGKLAPLMTRDCLLPILTPLAAAVAEGKTLADLVAALPPRFTAADRIAGIETDVSKAFIARLTEDASARAGFFADMGSEEAVDLTDGLRLRFESGDVVHLRPSGNAPEFRCYAEAATSGRAEELVTGYLGKLGRELA